MRPQRRDQLQRSGQRDQRGDRQMRGQRGVAHAVAGNVADRQHLVPAHPVARRDRAAVERHDISHEDRLAGNHHREPEYGGGLQRLAGAHAQLADIGHGVVHHQGIRHLTPPGLCGAARRRRNGIWPKAPVHTSRIRRTTTVWDEARPAAIRGDNETSPIHLKNR